MGLMEFDPLPVKRHIYYMIFVLQPALSRYPAQKHRTGNKRKSANVFKNLS